MLNILTVTAPIYLLIGFGFCAVKFGFTPKTDGQALGRFVMMVGLPAMLFNALASRNFEDVIHPSYFAAYAFGSLFAFAVMFVFARYASGKGLTQSALMALGASSSNSGYIGYPILLQVLGPSAGIGLALVLLVENLIIIPLGLTLAESGQAQQGTWQSNVIHSFKRLTKIPLMWGIVLGFVCSLMGWHLPEVLDKTINLLAATCAGIALFVNGGSLVGLQVRGLVKQVGGIAVSKLLMHPLAVLFFLWLCGPVDAFLEVSGMLLAAMPMLGIYPLIGQRFGQEGPCAAALLVTTIASFFTISAVLIGMTWVPAWAVLMR